MVKLPDVTALGARDPRAVGLQPSFPNIPKGDPAAAALQDFGQNVQGLGSVLMAKADEQKREQLRLQEFNQSNRLLMFEQDWSDHVAQRMQSVEPGAAGFTASLAKDFNPQARKFMEGVPPELKAEFDQRLKRKEHSIRTQAGNFEREEARRFSVEQTVKSEDTLLLRGHEDPTAWRGLDAEGARVWDSNPHIDNIERGQRKEQWAERRAIAEHDQLRDMDPRAARDALLPQPGAADSAALIRQFEGFRSSPYWDVNAQRVGYGSDTITTANGTIKQVTKGMVVSREDAERDLQRRIGEFQNGIARSVGQDKWSGLSENQQAALTSVAYNYGKLPDSVASAVKSGDPEAIAQSIEGLARHNGGTNAARRMQEAAIARGEAGTGLDPRFASLSYEKRVDLIKASDVAIEKQRRDYLTDIDDYTTFLRAGNPEVEVGRYSAQDLIENLGPEDAAVVHEKIQQAEAVGADVKALQWASPAEVNAIILERQEMLESPDDFRQNAQDLNGLAEVIRDRAKRLVDDPAKYVLEDSIVSEAYAAMEAAPAEERPAAARAYVMASTALQERLGLPRDMQRVLTVARADEIGRQFNDQVAGGQNAAIAMQTLSAQWGNQWPQVLGELGEHLPPSAMVIASMNRPDQMRAAERLAEAAAIGEKALKNTLPEDTAKAVDDELEASHGLFSTGAGGTLQDLWATLRHNPIVGQETFGAVKESVRLLALSYAGQGMDPATAASRAADEIIGKGYTFNETYRVPSEIDADAVADGAARALESFGARPEMGIGTVLGRTSEGRPIIINDEGGLSTEITTTIEDPRTPGRWLNVPTLFGGKPVSPDEAVRIVSKAGFTDPETGRAVESFPSMEGAEQAARLRTQTLDTDPNIRAAFKRLEGGLVDLPVSLMGLPEEDVRPAYLSQVQANGFWVTDPDETGLELRDEQGGAVTVAGKPVRFTWDELTSRRTTSTPPFILSQ